MYLRFIVIFCLFIDNHLIGVLSYKIPNVKFEVLSAGFRVSIPDENGIKNVAFNVNRNRPFKAYEQGEYSAQIREPVQGFWSLEVKRKLQKDDVLYVWTNVQHNHLIFRSISERIRLEDYQSNNISPEDKISTPTAVDSGKCESSITVVQGTNNDFCKGQLIFEENFDGRLNASLWKQEVRLPLDDGDAEFVLYETNSEVHGGRLEITPLLWNDDRLGTDLKFGNLVLGTRCTGYQDRVKECNRQPVAHNIMPPVISARINTKNSFNFKYGRIDIRAKVPEGDWIYPLLLLEPQTNQYGHRAYTSGQMRIAFTRGNKDLTTAERTAIDGRTLYGGAVLSPLAEYREKSMVSKQQNKHFGEDFHVYSLLWSNRNLILQVDGQEYGTISGGFSNIYSSAFDYATSWGGGDFMAPFDQLFYITLGLAVGGHGDFPDDCVSGQYKKPWVNTSPKGAYMFWQDRNNWKPTWTSPNLEVDYVRVYAI